MTAARLPAGGGAQIFLAVLGVSGYGVGADSPFGAHLILGFAMAGAAVLILILALIARPGALPLSLAGVAVQTGPRQSPLAGLAHRAALYGGPHALDRLLSLGIAGFGYASNRRRRSRMAGS